MKKCLCCLKILDKNTNGDRNQQVCLFFHGIVKILSKLSQNSIFFKILICVQFIKGIVSFQCILTQREPEAEFSVPLPHVSLEISNVCFIALYACYHNFLTR